MPGIVQNAEPEIVQLVEDLVTSHVQGNSLILVTLPMSGASAAVCPGFDGCMSYMARTDR